jgi:hypothetical protein
MGSADRRRISLPEWKVHAIMASVIPTQQEAQAALTEADRAAAWIRRTDKQFGAILLGMAAAYLAVGVLVGLAPAVPGFALVAIVVILVAALGGGVILLLRIRAYSRTGILQFTVSCAAFSLWNAIVVGVSSATRWWAPNQPTSHFTVSAVVAATPLVVAAWLVSRTRG